MAELSGIERLNKQTTFLCLSVSKNQYFQLVTDFAQSYHANPCIQLAPSYEQNSSIHSVN